MTHVIRIAHGRARTNARRLLTAAGLVVIAATTSPLHADELNVPGDYATVQSAIDAAAPGDEIVIAPGTYSVNLSIAKPLTLRTAEGPAATTFTPESSEPIISIGPVAEGAITVRGLTITGSAGAGAGIAATNAEVVLDDCIVRDNRGGGMRAVEGALTVIGCTFEANAADDGAAANLMQVFDASFTDCAFIDNTATGQGGAVFADLFGVLLDDCTFQDNVAARGGAVALGAFIEDAAINVCTFTGNSAAQRGGAVWVQEETSLTVTDAAFIDNSAGERGGALALDFDSFLDVQRCRFHDNTTGGDGGALWSGAVVLTMHNCLLAFNDASGSGGGAYWVDGFADILNCTIYGNSATVGGGLFGLSDAFVDQSDLINCVLWNNEADTGSQLALDGGTGAPLDELLIAACNLGGGPAQVALLAPKWEVIWGGANISAPPGFADPCGSAGEPSEEDPSWQDADFSLIAGSPNIDAGVDLGCDGVDLAGQPRCVDIPGVPEQPSAVEPPIIDLGAYEFQGSADAQDLDADGTIGEADLLALLAAWGACPSGACAAACQADFDHDGDVGVADLLTLLAAW